jgi:hypothetical protein
MERTDTEERVSKSNLEKEREREREKCNLTARISVVQLTFG